MKNNLGLFVLAASVLVLGYYLTTKKAPAAEPIKIPSANRENLHTNVWAGTDKAINATK